MTMSEEGLVTKLAYFLASLGQLERRPATGRASADYDHMGAKLTDAVLQSGINYENVVRPRVDRVFRDFPSGSTTSGFRAVLQKHGAATVLDLKGGRKLRTIVELTDCLADGSIETPASLRVWLGSTENVKRLHAVYGVGPKTTSFMKLLVGLDAIAVDVHVRRALAKQG
jgi:hypothetical protein